MGERKVYLHTERVGKRQGSEEGPAAKPKRKQASKAKPKPKPKPKSSS